MIQCFIITLCALFKLSLTLSLILTSLTRKAIYANKKFIEITPFVSKCVEEFQMLYYIVVFVVVVDDEYVVFVAVGVVDDVTALIFVHPLTKNLKLFCFVGVTKKK